MPDLAAIISPVVPLLTALGVGSVIGSVFGQWVAGSKDRRAARAAVLAKLGAVEAARWYQPGGDRAADSQKLFAAIRELETAALLARVPRAAVVPYARLAMTGLFHQHDEVERTAREEHQGLENTITYAIAGAAEVVSRAAWSAPAARWPWLHRALRANRREIDAIDDEGFVRMLGLMRRSLR